jgi:hypothetical protein
MRAALGFRDVHGFVRGNPADRNRADNDVLDCVERSGVLIGYHTMGTAGTGDPVNA